MFLNRKYFYAMPLGVLFISASTSLSFGAGFIETFEDAAYRDRWNIANFDQGGSNFVTAWRRKLASVTLPSAPRQGGGQLRMTIQPAPPEANKPIQGVQLSRGTDNHFGSYEVAMTAADGSGLISAFFVYTGPFFEDPHDEVDIEILGRDTTKVWVNKFADGEQMPGEWIDLGLDASWQEAIYRFEWTPNAITWYVNGRKIHDITAVDHTIPQNPGKLYLNLWAGNEGQRQWLGRVPVDFPPSQMTVSCVSYRPFGDLGDTCSDYFDATAP